MHFIDYRLFLSEAGAGFRVQACAIHRLRPEVESRGLALRGHSWRWWQGSQVAAQAHKRGGRPEQPRGVPAQAVTLLPTLT